MTDSDSCVSQVWRGALTFGLSAIAGLLALGSAGGCSSNSNNPAATANSDGAAAPVCPATPQDTIDKPCASEGTICAPTYACGDIQASLYCICTSGTFQCVDGSGAVLDAGDSLPCMGDAGSSATCPSSEVAAELAPCASPGQVCAYPSACQGMLDSCYCFPGVTPDGGFGKTFVCEPATCGSEAGPLPAVDSGSSAVDSGPAVDATGIDATGSSDAADGGGLAD